MAPRVSHMNIQSVLNIFKKSRQRETIHRLTNLSVISGVPLMYYNLTPA